MKKKRFLAYFEIGSAHSLSCKLILAKPLPATQQEEILMEWKAQSNELTRGFLVSLVLSFIGGVHIGARALHVLNLKWFGYIAHLSQWGEGGNFLVQMIFFFVSYA
jgi:hypothetical protein